MLTLREKVCPVLVQDWSLSGRVSFQHSHWSSASAAPPPVSWFAAAAPSCPEALWALSAAPLPRPSCHTSAPTELTHSQRNVESPENEATTNSVLWSFKIIGWYQSHVCLCVKGTIWTLWPLVALVALWKLFFLWVGPCSVSLMHTQGCINTHSPANHLTLSTDLQVLVTYQINEAMHQQRQTKKTVVFVEKCIQHKPNETLMWTFV